LRDFLFVINAISSLKLKQPFIAYLLIVVGVE